MCIYTVFFTIVMLSNRKVQSRTVFNSIPNLRSNDAPMHAESDFTQEVEELPNLRALHDDTQPMSESVYESAGLLNDPRSSGDGYNFKDEILFHPQKEAFTLDKRGSIPVSNKIDQKRNFIDSNTVGIVIDPRTRKTVGVLENTVDTFHGWKTNDDNYLSGENYNLRSDLLNVHGLPENLNVHGIGDRSSGVADFAYPISKMDSFSRNDLNPFRKYEDTKSARVLDDLNMPMDYSKIAKRNSENANNPQNNEDVKKTDMVISPANIDQNLQETPKSYNTMTANLKAFSDKTDNEKGAVDLLKRSDDKQIYQSDRVGGAGSRDFSSLNKPGFADQRLAAIYQQLMSNHKDDEETEPIGENEASIEDNLKNVVGQLNSANDGSQFEDKDLKKRETVGVQDEDEDMEKDENDIELKKRDTVKGNRPVASHDAVPQGDVEKRDSNKADQLKDSSLRDADEKDRLEDVEFGNGERAQRLAKVSSADSSDMNSMYASKANLEGDTRDSRVFSRHADEVKRSAGRGSNDKDRGKRQEQHARKDANKVTDDVKELFERREKRTDTDQAAPGGNYKIVRQIGSSDVSERVKRANEKTSNENDLVKGLANSGDLKVSGNKSPLATSADNTPSNDGNPSNSVSKIKRLAEDDDRAEYERQIEAQIQAKINAIKEQVKREIAAQKSVKNQYDTSTGNDAPNVEEPAPMDREKRYSNMFAPDEADQNSDALDAEVGTRARRRRNLDRLPAMALTRHKRANAVVPYQQSAFLPYRAEDDEDDEGNEFDDDGFDDRTSNLMQKRQASYMPYQNKADFDEQGAYEYPPFTAYRKRDVNRMREYMSPQGNVELEAADMFDYAPQNYVRRKRDSFRHGGLTAGLHGGGGALASRSALRSRNAQLTKSGPNEATVRIERSEARRSVGAANERNPIASLSDSAEGNDFFGALPQTYQGELTRLKRVKRDGDNGK